MTFWKLLATAAGAVIVAIVAAVAIWWFFIRSDAELATEPPDIPSDLAATSEPGTTPAGDGDVLTFRIVPEESEAAYFVGEELASFGLPSTATGATQQIAGEFHLNADGTGLAEGETSQFTVDLTTLQSDESRRDNRVQEALETSQFPEATFTITSVEGFDASLPQDQDQTFSLTGTFDLHGVQREVAWEVQARREGDVITALATLPFTFAEYHVTPPSIAGFVSVEDHGTLQVQLIARLV